MQDFIGKKLELIFSLSFDKCQWNQGFKIPIKCIRVSCSFEWHAFLGRVSKGYDCSLIFRQLLRAKICPLVFFGIEEKFMNNLKNMLSWKGPMMIIESTS